MKKIITITSFLLILCTLFSSCGDDFPSYSENFDKDFCETFYDNYFLADAGLAYYKAYPEVKIPPNRINPYHPDRYMIIGEIENTDKSQFVSVIADAEHFPLMGSRYDGYVCTYQHKNAPNPMEDWNIESITIVYGLIYNRVADAFTEKIDRYMDDCLSLCREVKKFTNETDSSFINGIQNAYLSATRDKEQTRVEYTPESTSPIIYYLIVKFKESSNIIWYTPLVISYDGFRICHTFDNYEEYSTYEGPNGYSNANKEATFSFEGLETHYGTLSEEITNELYEILVADGWDPENNKPASSIHTTAPNSDNSGSSNIPSEDIVPKTD